MNFSKLILIFFQTGAHRASELEIVKWWNGVTTEDKIGVIAIKSNGPIEKCVWIHQDTGDEYR